MMGTEGTDERPGAVVDQHRRQQHVRALYDRNVIEVYQYVLRRCMDQSLAEDITQDVFLAAVRASTTNEISIGWLLRAARNRLIDVVRRTDTHSIKLRLLAASDRAGTRRDVATSVAERVAVQRALARLSTDHRIVLLLRYVDDLSIEELAAAIDRPPKGVESLLTRARKAFGLAMEEPA